MAIVDADERGAPHLKRLRSAKKGENQEISDSPVYGVIPAAVKSLWDSLLSEFRFFRSRKDRVAQS